MSYRFNLGDLALGMIHDTNLDFCVITFANENEMNMEVYINPRSILFQYYVTVSIT